MKLKVKYVFPTSSSGTNFLFIRCLKIWKCEKNISESYQNAKVSTNQVVAHLLGFQEHRVNQSQSLTFAPTQKFQQ